MICLLAFIFFAVVFLVGDQPLVAGRSLGQS